MAFSFDNIYDLKDISAKVNDMYKNDLGTLYSNQLNNYVVSPTVTRQVEFRAGEVPRPRRFKLPKLPLLLLALIGEGKFAQRAIEKAKEINRAIETDWVQRWNDHMNKEIDGAGGVRQVVTFDTSGLKMREVERILAHFRARSDIDFK